MSKTDTKIDLKRVILPPGRLLIREVPPETVSPGGIILTTDSRAKRCIAVVVLMGAEPIAGGLRDAGIHKHLAVGDEIIVGKFAMQESAGEELGEGLHTTDETEVLVIVKPKKGKKR